MNVIYYVHTKYWDEPFKFEDAAEAEECSHNGYRVTAEVQT